MADKGSITPHNPSIAYTSTAPSRGTLNVTVTINDVLVSAGKAGVNNKQGEHVNVGDMEMHAPPYWAAKTTQ